MAKTRTVYSTQDDGAGTLRDALRAIAIYTQEWIDGGALENDDIIDFSDELEVDGVITILLSAQLSTPTNNISIDGGEHTGSGATLATRVVLDAQGNATNDTWRVMNGPSTSGGSVNINGVTFKNGYHDASGYFGGGFNARNSNENVFSYCVFDSCGAKSGAGVYGTTNTINTFNNCVFKNNNAFNSYGGGVYSYNGQMAFNNCHFINNNANAQGGAVYVNSTLDNTFNSCVFNGNAATTGGDLYTATNSLVTFQGSQTLTNAVFSGTSQVTLANNAELTLTTSTVNSSAFSAETGETAKITFAPTPVLTNATFTNVSLFFVVTSTLDDGTGTLRNALTHAVSGTTITFDDSLEDTNGVITILLSSQLQLPAKDLTIDGGSHTGSGETLQTRVILDAQNASNILYGAGYNVVICKDLTLKNGSSDDGGGVTMRCIPDPNKTNFFNYCVFDTCAASNRGGAFRTVNQAVNELNSCYFTDCSAYYGAGIYVYNTSVTTVNNCVFTNGSATYGGGVVSGSSGQSILNNCVFNLCGATTYGNSVYIYNTSQTTINNCSFIPPENNTKTTIYNNGTNIDGSLIINGATSCDRVQFAANSTTVINDKLTAGTLNIGNGASITLSGVDSVLAVTNAATIGSATFTAAENSTGYAAFPSGTDTTAATFTGVKVATYSATVATVSATVVEREATITTNVDVATSVVEAIFDDSTLSPLSVSAGKAAISKDRAFKVRIFNGSFYESSWVPRTYYYQGGTTGSFATASDWAMDSAKTLTCNAAPTIANSTFDCR